jgi:catechol 2,3-dioxygenase-like lactoylglutathione lyase family enzyme
MQARAHYLWAVLMARIYEVFPLVCPICGGQMRIIAIITHNADIRRILEHIGVETEPPRITPARGPPLCDGCEAQIGEGVDVASDWDDVAQVAPDFEATLQRLGEAGFEVREERELWGQRRAKVLTPAGHTVELMAAPPAPAAG